VISLISAVFHFSEFELDPARYELRKRGRRIKLQRIPMELLLVLAKHQGELVLRSDLARIWAPENPPDVEHGINTAVGKIRRALGDNADRPHFIETVPGKGYRFIAKISEPEETPPPVGEPSIPTPDPVEKTDWKQIRFAASAVAALGLTLACGVWLWRNVSAGSPAMSVAPFTALPGSESDPSFSPDGSRVAFAWAADGDASRICIKAVAGGTEKELTAPDGADSNPAWSPDGNWIAFLRTGRSATSLVVVSTSGTNERRLQVLSSTATRSRIAWTPNGTAVAVADSDPPGSPTAIFIISADSGRKRRITEPAPPSQGDGSPVFSPDGKKMAFIRNAGSLQIGSVYVLPVDRSGGPLADPTEVATTRRDLTSVAWSAGGRFLIGSATGGLVRFPATGGAADPLPFQDATDPSVSPDGRRIVYTRHVEETAIYRLPGPGWPGTMSNLIASSRFNGSPKYSPDGSQIVFMSNRTGVDELWITNGDGRNPRPLTAFRRATLGSPRWSPDGKEIAFDSTVDGHAKIYVIPAGTGSPRRVTFGPSTDVRPSWSHDGASIYFASDSGGAWQIWKTSRTTGKPVQVTRGGGREAFEDPDGRFLYYVKAAPTAGIWRMSLPGGPAEQITQDGVQGEWAVGRRGLYYRNRRNQLEMLVLSTGDRIPLPEPALPPSRSSGGLLAVGPDDRWILVTVRVRSESDLSIVENFR
jgi:Tol biopolymer transport system component/DNA-binding winged helix-turn-helix (wHTH) protein